MMVMLMFVASISKAKKGLEACYIRLFVQQNLSTLDKNQKALSHPPLSHFTTFSWFIFLKALIIVPASLFILSFLCLLSFSLHLEGTPGGYEFVVLFMNMSQNLQQP